METYEGRMAEEKLSRPLNFAKRHLEITQVLYLTRTVMQSQLEISASYRCDHGSEVKPKLKIRLESVVITGAIDAGCILNHGALS